MSVTLRPGTSEDLIPCATILYEAFRTISAQHSFPPDFPSREPAEQLMSFLLSCPDVYSVVAESGGRATGSNFLWETGPVVGVGPITVDPAAQDRSTGRKLMENVLQRARERGFAGVRLVQAGYHTRSLSLYAKLGFDVREHLATLQGQPLGASVPGLKVRPATPEDTGACNRLHAKIHGFERGRELLDAMALGTAQVVERNSRVSGYATSIGFFGHAVGESNEELKALIGAAQEFSGPGFHLPTRNGELFRWCLERGLKVEQPMTLMSLGLYNEPKGAWLPSILF
jgi:GNAT superfamily N-acetyltransferase